MKYYLIKNSIMMSTSEMPTKASLEMSHWIISLQTCKIVESEMEKIIKFLYKDLTNDNTPIDVTDIVDSEYDGHYENIIITFKQPSAQVEGYCKVCRVFDYKCENNEAKDYILNKYPHLKREGENPIIDFELLDLCSFIDEYSKLKIENFKVEQAKFLLEIFNKKQFDNKADPNEKPLEYWKKNAEENYLTTPISVLKYITVLEKIVNSEK